MIITLRDPRHPFQLLKSACQIVNSDQKRCPRFSHDCGQHECYTLRQLTPTTPVEFELLLKIGPNHASISKRNRCDPSCRVKLHSSSKFSVAGWESHIDGRRTVFLINQVRTIRPASAFCFNLAQDPRIRGRRLTHSGRRSFPQAQ